MDHGLSCKRWSAFGRGSDENRRWKSYFLAKKNKNPKRERVKGKQSSMKIFPLQVFMKLWRRQLRCLASTSCNNCKRTTDCKCSTASVIIPASGIYNPLQVFIKLCRRRLRCPALTGCINWVRTTERKRSTARVVIPAFMTCRGMVSNSRSLVWGIGVGQRSFWREELVGVMVVVVVGWPTNVERSPLRLINNSNNDLCFVAQVWEKLLFSICSESWFFRATSVTDHDRPIWLFYGWTVWDTRTLNGA